MKELFYFAIGVIAVILFLVDHFIATAGSSEAPKDEEDVPVTYAGVGFATHPDVTMWSYMDKDGNWHSGKNN